MRTTQFVATLGVAALIGATATAQRRGQASPTATPTPPASPRIEKLKADAAADVRSMSELTAQMIDQVFSFGELGFQEVETSKYLTGVLEKNGFTIERNYAGIPTAWVATWGSGKPVIALGSDIDDIPQASQKPGVAYHDPIVAGAPGHGEGHNSGVPLNITAALAVKKIMEREHLPGTLKLWPGVAEELLGSKAYYIRAGLFKDVDVNLFAHVGNNLGVSWGGGFGTGAVSVEYLFKGESAHAAAAPWRGRSALDAVELMDVGWNFRREHLRLQQRSHNVISQRRRPAERRAAQRRRLVLLPRNRLPAHPRAVGHRQHDGEGRRDDDQHRGHLAHPRIGVAGAHEQDGGRDDVREHREGRPAALGRGGRDARQGHSARAEAEGDRPRHDDRSAARAASIRRGTWAGPPTTSATSRGTCRR